jgi:hypothetical protein
MSAPFKFTVTVSGMDLVPQYGRNTQHKGAVMAVVKKLAKDLVVGDRLWKSHGEHVLIQRVRRGMVADIWSDTFEEKEAVLYTYAYSGGSPMELWYWPNNEVEVVID